MNLIEILVERVQEMIAGFMRTLPQLAIAVAILLITWGLAHLIRSTVGRMTARTRLRPSLAALLVTLAGGRCALAT